MDIEDMVTPNPLLVDYDSESDSFFVHNATQLHQMGLLRIPGAHAARKGKNHWILPARYLQIVALGNTFKLDWTEAAIERYSMLSATVESCKELRTSGLTAENEQLIRSMLEEHNVSPKEGQTAAIVHVVTAGGAGLFSEPGSGKSLVVSGAIGLYGLRSVLIVCPVSVIYNWQRELSRFGVGSVTLDGTKGERDKAVANLDLTATPVVICSYGIAKKLTRQAKYGSTTLKRCNDCGGFQDVPEDKCEVHERFLNTIEWDAVVLDEAHRIRDPHTAQTRAAWFLAHSAPNRWLLTGTPIESTPDEFWSLLHAMDPIEYPSSTKHRDRYMLETRTFWGTTEIVGLNPTTREEYDEVTQWRWRRDVKVGLPPVRSEVRTCVLGAKQAKAYRQMRDQLMAEIGLTGKDDTTVLIADNHMVKFGRCMQFANATCEIDGNGEVQMTDPSSKLDLFEDTLEDVGEPCIAWFASKKLLKLAADRLDKKEIKYALIHGEITGKKRQAAIDAFQNGEVDLILLNPKAGGEGITLTRARVAIWVMHDPSSIVETQANNRNHRYGVEYDELLSINLITLGTIEEEALPKMMAKFETAKEVLGS